MHKNNKQSQLPLYTIIALFPTKMSCILADGFDDILFYVKTLKKLTTQGTSL